MASAKNTVYDISGCTFSYRGFPCLSNINLELQQGKLYGLIGPNGSGKTTLLNLLTGTTKPTSGTVNLYSSKIHRYSKRDLARKLSFVPQSFSMEFEYTVFEVVLMGRHPFIDRFGQPTNLDIELVTASLKTLDILHLKDRYITQLSGGERQRVIVARALTQNTGVMILDEATASLDVRHSIDIMHALKSRVANAQSTIIAAIHDLDLAASFCDELIVMQDGRIYTNGPVNDVLTSKMLKHVFSVKANIAYSPENTAHIQYRYTHA